MGVSTDAIICYGISFEAYYEFPWSDDIERWWLEVQGYRPPFEIFNGRGDYIGGIQPPAEQISKYFQARREFFEKYPIPIKEVMHCSGNYPMFILAAKGSVKRATRGSPEKFDPQSLYPAPKAVHQLIEFCEKWKLEGDGPAWWLCSLWL